MRKAALFCYITDRSAFAGDEQSRRKFLLEKIGEATRNGVDFVQLREKDLSGREWEELAGAARHALRRGAQSSTHPPTKLLINGRTDIALAVGVDGVHLPSHDLTVREVRDIWIHAGRKETPVVSVACHSIAEAQAAASDGADLVLFAPVFGKKDAPGMAPTGLDALREASRVTIPVLALGGVTIANAADCLDAGAAGIAGIRLFQEGNLSQTMAELRSRLGDSAFGTSSP